MEEVLHISAPVYYVQSFKTKKAKTHLISLNTMRTAHYYLQNAIKQWQNDFFMNEFKKHNFTKIKGEYKVAYVYYYKNIQSDMPNVLPQISKAFLDAAQKYGLVAQDNVKHCVQECHYVGKQDKDNPRAEIYLQAMPTKESNGPN
jgi:hypothetical protein